MSEDWLVRGARGLDFTDVVSALLEVDPELRVRADATRRHVVVVGEKDTPIVWIGLSRSVVEPDHEAPRLGIPVAARLDSWTEITGPAAGARLVARVALALAEVVAGRADRLSTAPLAPPSDEQPSRSGDCPCDIVDTHVGVLLQSRALVHLTPWLVEALSWAGRAGLTPVVLTPPTTRTTRAVLDFLAGVQGRWVVGYDDRFVDGDTGAVLDWVDGRFVPSDQDRSAADGPVGHVLTVEASTRHAYDAEIVIGDFARELASAAGMPAPTAHGGLEPVEHTWDPQFLTALASDASPDPITQILHGEGLQGQVEVHPQPSWIDEHVTLWAAPEFCTARDTEEIAQACLKAGARQVIVARRPSGIGAGADVVPCPPGAVELMLVIAALDDLPGVDTEELVAVGRGHGRLLDTRIGQVFVLDLDDDPEGTTRFVAVRDVLAGAATGA